MQTKNVVFRFRVRFIGKPYLPQFDSQRSHVKDISSTVID